VKHWDVQDRIDMTLAERQSKRRRAHKAPEDRSGPQNPAEIVSRLGGGILKSLLF
jgi:hypothetical protein